MTPGFPRRPFACLPYEMGRVPSAYADEPAALVEEPL